MRKRPYISAIAEINIHNEQNVSADSGKFKYPREI